MQDKPGLRERMRKARRAHVAALRDETRALLFRRPPTPVTQMIAPGSTIGLYHASPVEAPASGYARWFVEEGHTIALPWFAAKDAPMVFRRWHDPFGETDLEPGPFGAGQPAATGEDLVPDVLFVPLIGFTENGGRLGQGGGHYDRWLEAHPGTLAIGLAWDMQRLPALPVEPHDRPLDAVVTPTRTFGPFARGDAR